MKEKEITKVLKALANARRLRILSHLKKENGATVSGVARNIKLSFKATSKHLIILYAAGIIEKEQRSLDVYCCITKNVPQFVKYILKSL
ncbi:MAG: helix-turn-helix transcriptional regulator [Patescibacteria group bacterium]